MATMHPGPADCSVCGVRLDEEDVMICVDCRAPPGQPVVRTYCRNCYARATVSLADLEPEIRPLVRRGDSVRSNLCANCAPSIPVSARGHTAFRLPELS